MSNSLDSGETPSYSASHPDPSCLYKGTFVVLGGLGVNLGFPTFQPRPAVTAADAAISMVKIFMEPRK